MNTLKQKRVFSGTKASDYAVLNLDNSWTRSMGSKCPARCVFFSRREKVPGGVYVRGDEVIVDIEGAGRVVALSFDDIKVPGGHNIENFLAVAAVTALAGCDFEYLRSVARILPGSENGSNLSQRNAVLSSTMIPVRRRPAGLLQAFSHLPLPLSLLPAVPERICPLKAWEVIAERVKSTVLVGDTAHEIESAIRRAEKNWGVT